MSWMVLGLNAFVLINLLAMPGEIAVATIDYIWRIADVLP